VIKSSHNQRVKDIRRLLRRRDGRFVAEGEDLLDAAEAAGWPALDRLVAGVDVEEEVLARVSGLASGTRALAVYEERWLEAPAGPLCVALWGVRDPGNVGTVLRSAHAFGADSVAIGPGTADPYGPKAVRASMGAIFAVGVARVSEVAALPGPAVALDAGAEAPLRGVGGETIGTLVVGAEREGLSPAVVAACERAARIPIAAGDSLNAAMAATVALYEWTRHDR
jgi:RNA methyltransferase, TrmH family